jgi:hypothetical protein
MNQSEDVAGFNRLIARPSQGLISGESEQDEDWARLVFRTRKLRERSNDSAGRP